MTSAEDRVSRRKEQCQMSSDVKILIRWRLMILIEFGTMWTFIRVVSTHESMIGVGLGEHRGKWVDPETVWFEDWCYYHMNLLKSDSI